MQQIISFIYNHLQDNKSKNIFSNRLLYSLTNDRLYLNNIIKDSCVFDKICEILDSAKGELVIFGAGEWGQMFYDLFHEFRKFKCFVDNNKNGFLYGIPVISVEEWMQSDKESTIFICSWLYHKEQYAQLKELGISEERIVDILPTMNREMVKKQYFDLEELLNINKKEEIFVDGGAYNGETTLRFKKWCQGNFKMAYVFEPDYSNFLMCRNNLKKQLRKEEFAVYNLGLSDRKDELYFESNKDSSRLVQTGNMKVKVDSLDNLISGDVSFIKLDVEGAEGEAIKGAENLIKRCKPKLAISLYHKPEDIWEIPDLILRINPEYKLYLRHYTLLEYETVLYAI